MEAELAALAASGATTLVGLMVSDVWAQARDRVAGLFAHGGDRSAGELARIERSQAEQLQASREALLTARASQDEATAADITQEWEARLRRLLRGDPAMADELRRLLDELRPQLPQQPAVSVHNTISDGEFHAPVFQAARISGVRFGVSGSSAQAGEESA
ncbi:hypothetical protein [Streptomyces sp. NPDC014734]|uniref:hypothetical protein n=1 Tax=Streptomyces sp. NPDC014734 TaxID=3364886 RepID=UPI0036F69B38